MSYDGSPAFGEAEWKRRSVDVSGGGRTSFYDSRPTMALAYISLENALVDPEDVYEPYEYFPLNEEAKEIRLLTLLPGTFNSELRVCLDITPFTESKIPRFEAVSYVWGSTEDPAHILIGKVGRKTLAVTQNLAEALPYFRYIDKPRVLWIDAICVDQQNLPERGQQVKRMAAIYSKAAQVLVWLGPQSDDSPLVFDLIENIAKHVKIDEITTGLVAISNEVVWADTTLPLSLTETEAFALYTFIHRPWFERLWVWQEVKLATSSVLVLCGNKIILWPDLCVAVSCLFCKGFSGLPEINSTEYNMRLGILHSICTATLGQAYLTPDNLIERTKHCLCSDPRDKVDIGG